MTPIHDLHTQLKKSRQILITTHRDPDYDALGSCLGFQGYLNQIGQESYIWSHEFKPKGFRALSDTTAIHPGLPPGDFLFDTLVVLDASSLDRVAGFEFIKPYLPGLKIINIDHHKDNTRFGDINCVTQISSVGEYLTTIFEQLPDAVITPTMARDLYSAIVYDTGRFSHSSVTAQTLRMGAQLIEIGVQPEAICQAIFETRDPGSLTLLKAAIDELVIHPKLPLAYTVLTSSDPQAGYEAVDLIRSLDGIEVFFVARQAAPTIVKINFRSKTDFDVSEFAKEFGGGGHAKAAGVAIDGQLDKVVPLVIRAFEKAMGHGA